MENSWNSWVMKNYQKQINCIVVLFLNIALISACGTAVTTTPVSTPTQIPVKTSTPRPTSTVTPTPTRDPSIPFGITYFGHQENGSYGKTNDSYGLDLNDYYSVIPLEWLSIDGGTAKYSIEIMETRSYDNGFSCSYSDANNPNLNTFGYLRGQNDLNIRLLDYATGSEVNSINISASIPSSDPCPYIYDESYDFSKYQTEVSIDSFVSSLFELIQPVENDFPLLTLETALKEATNPRPTPTAKPMDIASMLKRICNDSDGSCSTYAIVDSTNDEWMPALNSVIDEFYGLSTLEYVLLSEQVGIFGNSEDCDLIQSLRSCISERQGRNTVCYISYDWQSNSLTPLPPECDGIYLTLPAKGANSGKSIFDPSTFSIINNLSIDVSREEMQEQLATVFPK